VARIRISYFMRLIKRRVSLQGRQHEWNSPFHCHTKT
jgi:hypothetical protein